MAADDADLADLCVLPSKTNPDQRNPRTDVMAADDADDADSADIDEYL